MITTFQSKFSKYFEIFLKDSKNAILKTYSISRLSEQLKSEEEREMC